MAKCKLVRKRNKKMKVYTQYLELRLGHQEAQLICAILTRTTGIPASEDICVAIGKALSKGGYRWEELVQYASGSVRFNTEETEEN